MVECPEFVKGARFVLGEALRHSAPPIRKMRRMEEVCLNRSGSQFNAEAAGRIRQAGEAVRFKYLLTSFQLEELWTLSTACRWELVTAIHRPTEDRWDADETILGSHYLESFLMQARAFLDLFLRYGCLLLKADAPITAKLKQRRKALNRVAEEPFGQRALRLLGYLDQEVFAKDKWGAVLRDLRDRIAHRDMLHPSDDGTEEVAGSRLAWPTIQSMTFERLGQGFENGMFEMIRDTAPMLFNLEWKSVPYRHDLWD